MDMGPDKMTDRIVVQIRISREKDPLIYDAIVNHSTGARASLLRKALYEHINAETRKSQRAVKKNDDPIHQDNGTVGLENTDALVDRIIEKLQPLIIARIETPQQSQQTAGVVAPYVPIPEKDYYPPAQDQIPRPAFDDEDHDESQDIARIETPTRFELSAQVVVPSAPIPVGDFYTKAQVQIPRPNLDDDHPPLSQESIDVLSSHADLF